MHRQGDDDDDVSQIRHVMTPGCVRQPSHQPQEIAVAFHFSLSTISLVMVLFVHRGAERERERESLQSNSES